MDKLNLYIGKTLAISIFLAISLFVGIDLIFSLVVEARQIGQGSYTSSQAFLYVLLSLPSKILDLFPMAVLVGSLMGLGLLASHNELIAMQIAGLSRFNLTLRISQFAIVLALIICAVGEYVAPITEKIAHQQKAYALSDGQALTTKGGSIWLKDEQYFIYIQEVQPDGKLKGITFYEMSPSFEILKASHAKSGEYKRDQWNLSDVEQTEFKKNKTVRNYLSNLHWKSKLSPEIVNLMGTKTLDELSFQEIQQALKYHQSNELEVKPYQLALWQKMVRPFSIFVMMFLAIPFVFGPLRQVSRGLRLLIGILCGFSFYLINQLFGPLTLVYSMPAIVGAWLPTMLFLSLAMWFYKRVP